MLVTTSVVQNTGLHVLPLQVPPAAKAPYHRPGKERPEVVKK